jgi:cellulose synthase/poly-beta-1,6-N-acetylglucosamine synthase-like glycosyltransferase
MRRSFDTIFYPKVSVVVPVHNGARTIAACLGSLMALDYPKEALEIIVVDNNSRDATPDIIKQYPVKYYRLETRRTRAAARNKGIKESTGELIAFTDGDCVVDQDWLNYLVQGFTHPIIAGCGGRVLSYQPQNWIEQFYHNTEPTQETTVTGEKLFLPYIITRSAIFRRGGVEEVGLFDEDLCTWTDIDLGWRIYLKGYQFRYIPEAIIYHKYRDTFWGFCKHSFRYARAGPKLIQKYQNLKILSQPRSLSEWIESFFRPFRSIAHWSTLGKKKKAFQWKFLFLVGGIISLSGIFFNWLRLTLTHASGSPRIVVNDRPLWHQVDDDKIIIFRTTERSYYTLDGLGSEIWKLLVMGNKTLNEVIEIISDKYKVTQEEVKKDVTELLGELKQAGFEIMDFIR